jgi:hypothetical protein
MTTWRKYTELDPVRRLQFKGNELLTQNTIYLFEKRDGANVSVWLNNDGGVCISSHNEENAEGNIQNKMRATPEFSKIVDLLQYEERFRDRKLIAYGELDISVSPTRCEMRKKHIHWTMFDIYDVDAEKYLHNLELQSLARVYKLPLPRIVCAFSTMKLQDVETYIQDALKWCGRHKREGIVGKCYDTQVFFKEKRILKSPKKMRVPQPREQLPAMPEETIERAFEHAIDEVLKVGGNWNDTKIAMPIVAKHMQLEAREHNYAIPRDMYVRYLEKQQVPMK